MYIQIYAECIRPSKSLLVSISIYYVADISNKFASVCIFYYCKKLLNVCKFLILTI